MKQNKNAMLDIYRRVINTQKHFMYVNKKTIYAGESALIASQQVRNA